MKMKAFKMKNDENRLYFTNHDRISEDIILKNVLDKLKENPSFVENEIITGPSEDIRNCIIDDYEFRIIQDIDYGVMIYSDDMATIESLEKYFNG